MQKEKNHQNFNLRAMESNNSKFNQGKERVCNNKQVMAVNLSVFFPNFRIVFF